MTNREFSVSDEYRYNRRGPLRWIASHLWRHKLFLTTFILGTAAAQVLQSTIPYLTGAAFTEVLKPRPSQANLTVIALLVLAVVVGLFVVGSAGAFSSEFLAQRMERDSRDELYLSLLGKSQTFHNQQRVGDIMARAANDVRQLNPMINPGLSLTLESATGLITPIVFIGLIRVDLLIVPLAFTAVFLLAVRRYSRQLHPVSADMRQQFGRMNAGLEETITGIEVVKATAEEQSEKRKFERNARQYRDYFIRNGQIQAFYLPPLLMAISLVAAFLQGVYLHSIGELSIGSLIAFMGLMTLLQIPTINSIFTFTLLQLGVAGAERILTLMRQETELDENERGYAATMKGDIVFDEVTFGFGSVPVLRTISLHASPGEVIAIVGQTGSGKTTLTKLLNRSFDVGSGRILIDGVDVRDWSLDALRSQISTIEQDVFLFSRSIAENIAFGLGQQTDRSAIEQAAREAQAHEFIMTLPSGYDTIIGERGVTLSGGQRQRLAIARALLTDPRILILDDSTSAIDSATEDEIQKGIHRVMQGRTTLLITHRLSQIRRADRILVLRGGELLDQGSHEELLTRCELYRRIFVRYNAGESQERGGVPSGSLSSSISAPSSRSPLPSEPSPTSLSTPHS
ncbi:MAG: ABC transporter ATP-binding protein [Chloroflexi bacterium]|nr:MAG: ABC transporter ATP-binding protein [Chloroflexota bacterium]